MPGNSGQYRLSPLAELDMEDIWLYGFEKWSLEQADRYHIDIIAALESLSNGSKIGRRVDIRDGYFKYAIGSHLIFYRRVDFGLDVIRILHQKMDTSRHL